MYRKIDNSENPVGVLAAVGGVDVGLADLLELEPFDQAGRQGEFSRAGIHQRLALHVLALAVFRKELILPVFGHDRHAEYAHKPPLIVFDYCYYFTPRAASNVRRIGNPSYV